VITDDELLAACRSAGKPGTESHRKACRLYRQSVIEYQAATRQGQREHAARAALYLFIALLATEAIGAGWLGYTGCGTHDGYAVHARDKTLACPACLRAESEYSGSRRRARKQAAAEREQAWTEAA
jgi:hypothetical protein